MMHKSHTWAVAEAKAHLSQVIEKALESGPQTITRSGRKTVVMVSAEEWERKAKRKGNFAEFLAASPLRGSGVEIKRQQQKARKNEL